MRCSSSVCPDLRIVDALVSRRLRVDIGSKYGTLPSMRIGSVAVSAWPAAPALYVGARSTVSSKDTFVTGTSG
jgi:hypothetical protein